MPPQTGQVPDDRAVPSDAPASSSGHSTRLPPQISVIVCAFNEERNIVRCLEALVLQRGVLGEEFEVLIIDDGSTDDTGHLAEAFVRDRSGAPLMTYYESRHLGLSVARNTGLVMARAPLVAFLDSDAEPDEWWLSEMLAAWGAHPGADAIGGRIRIRNSQSWTALLLDRVYYDPMDRVAIIGANMAFRRHRLLEMGGFCDQFVSRGDDTFLLLKFGAGRQEVKWPRAVVFHDRPASLAQWLRERFTNGVMLNVIGRMQRQSTAQGGRFIAARLIVLTVLVWLSQLTGGVWPVAAAVASLGVVNALRRNTYSVVSRHYAWWASLPLTIAWTILEELGGWLLCAGWIRGGAVPVDAAKSRCGTLSSDHLVRSVRTSP